MHANIWVYTFKAGLLARVAHDLCLSVKRHELSVQAGKVRGQCDAASLQVEGVMLGNGLDRGTLSDSDKRQILETVQKEVLQTERHPCVELEGDLSADPARATIEVRGNLRLHGQTRPLHVALTRHGDKLEGAFELTPSEFGIPPYKALAGAIKLQDRVRVQVEIPLQGRDPFALLTLPDALQL